MPTLFIINRQEYNRKHLGYKIATLPYIRQLKLLNNLVWIKFTYQKVVIILQQLKATKVGFFVKKKIHKRRGLMPIETSISTIFIDTNTSTILQTIYYYSWKIECQAKKYS